MQTGTACVSVPQESSRLTETAVIPIPTKAAAGTYECRFLFKSSPTGAASTVASTSSFTILQKTPDVPNVKIIAIAASAGVSAITGAIAGLIVRRRRLARMRRVAIGQMPVSPASPPASLLVLGSASVSANYKVGVGAGQPQYVASPMLARAPAPAAVPDV
eukprot:tig00020995_g16909.t1